MATVKKEYVVKLMREKQLCFYTVKDSDGKSVIQDQQDSDYTPEKAASELENILNEIEGSHVFVLLSGKSRKQKSAGGPVSTDSYNLKVTLSPASIAGTGSGNSSREIALLREIGELKAEIKEKEFERKLQDLERKFDEQSGKNPMVEQFMPLILQYLTGGAQSVPMAAPGIAGPEEPSPKERLQAAINKLKTVDPNFIETISALADFAVRKPDMYRQYLPMLKNL